jgi:hypothetical protein
LISYSCRDEANVVLPTFAEPVGLAWGAVTISARAPHP